MISVPRGPGVSAIRGSCTRTSSASSSYSPSATYGGFDTMTSNVPPTLVRRSDAEDAEIVALSFDRDRDAAAARSDVDHPASSRRAIERRLDEKLRLRTRD